MSTQSLQRVAVRMLYDQVFLDRVYENVGAATRDCDLTTIEQDWLQAPDRRAWCVDPLRRSRSLAALIEEFAVSVAMFARASPDAATRMDSFFSSHEFHAGMQWGASLAAIFAGWLEVWVDESTHDLLRLEASLARVRRDFEAGLTTSSSCAVNTAATICLSPAVEVLELASDTVTRFSSMLGVLRRGEVVTRVLDAGVQLPMTASPSVEREGVLVDGRHEDPRLEILSVELARILTGASEPISFPEFARRAVVHGANDEDCLAIVSSFSEDGIVRNVSS